MQIVTIDEIAKQVAATFIQAASREAEILDLIPGLGPGLPREPPDGEPLGGVPQRGGQHCLQGAEPGQPRQDGGPRSGAFHEQ